MSWKLVVNYVYEKKDGAYADGTPKHVDAHGTCDKTFKGDMPDNVQEMDAINVFEQKARSKIERKGGRFPAHPIQDWSTQPISAKNASTGKTFKPTNKDSESTKDVIDQEEISINVDDIPAVNSDPEYNLLDEVTNAFSSHITWDPRLYRIDEYFVETDGKGDHMMRIPFASDTAVTAFADQTNRVEAGVVEAFIQKGLITNGAITKLYNNIVKEYETETSDDGRSQQVRKMTPKLTEKVIYSPTEDLERDSFNWGVQSIVNPYSLTKLVGGLTVTGDKNLINYMYDIRDQRRFYAIQEGENLTAVSNPTITQLIKWSNSDLWGRTPYSFQDFVYCKFFGLIPNNRLITLRRYHAPTYDNLQFDGMNGKKEQTSVEANGQKYTETINKLNDDNPNPQGKVFSPIAQVVTWFGGDTGNSLNSLMTFSTGINWGELESKIWDVTGETGGSKQAVIDKLLGDGDHSGLFGKSEAFGGAFSGPMSQLTGKIASFGKFHLALTGKIGISQDAFDNIAGANVDPYESTYRNRIQGPVNRIDKIKKRDPGIKFSQTLSIKCSYKAKAIGGINPKAALLDVLGNCLAIVSPHAVFWGGGHRFMIKPKVYPFHDGGWRDSFLAKIYDGKILGNNGAISTILSGFKKVGDDGQGHFDFDTAKDLLGKMGGSALGLLGAAISSLSDVFGGVDFLTNAADKVFQAGANVSGDEKAAIEKKGKNMASNLLTNLKQMWHNKMMAATAMPSIAAGGNILVGEPTGEWHLTIGNPLNPIMVIGNLVCNDMKVTWDEELGPDDFPVGFSVEYSLDHAMARDNDAIQSMFNRGMGKYYTLPDYMSTSSEFTTYVDKYTKNAGSGDVGTVSYKSAGGLLHGFKGGGYQKYYFDPGKTPPSHGNYNTTLITKFNPLPAQASRSISYRQNGVLEQSQIVISHIKSLATTRKLINN